MATSANSGGDPASSPGTTVPFKSSISSISAFAFLVPLLALLSSIHRHRAFQPGRDFHDLDDGLDPYDRGVGAYDFDLYARGVHRRLDPSMVCVNFTNATWAESKSNEEGSIATDAIVSTTIISASITFLCLLGYELFRRDPIVGKYVYDRKRLAQPDRTPPPLMLSRSLWRGPDDDGDGDGGKGGRKAGGCCGPRMWWCRVRPSLLEYIFLNLDERYISYARAADEAMRERERRGWRGCCRTGCYHTNCFNRHGRRFIDLRRGDDEEGFYVDEDGYTFYPGYCRDYSHVYRRGGGADDVSAKWSKDINDLFPEDDPRNFFAAGRPRATRGLFEGNISVSVESKAESLEASEKISGGIAPVDGGEGGGTTASQTVGSADSGKDDVDATGAVKEASEPSGCSSAGDLSHHVDAGQDAEEGGNAGSLISGGGLEHDADSGLRSPLLGEGGADADKSAPSISMVASANILKEAEEPEETEEPDTDPPEQPYRLKHLLMPPGFHSWSNVIQYITYFFFLQPLINWCRKVPTPTLPLVAGHRHPNRSSRIMFSKPGKDLTEGEAELLRCAGLDTYMLVRLTRFGFDVTFYPFLASIVTVLPVYFSCGGAMGGGWYLNLTINIIPDGDGRIVWVIVFTFFLYLYIMRRLWFEWEVFIGLRHSFLANGDPSFFKSPTYLRTYRNSVIVESVPKTHRSDRNLTDVFESLFPGQIDHAEMLIDTTTLEDLLAKRLGLIEEYDSITARYRYECWRYATWEKNGRLVGPCACIVAKPAEPMVTGRCLDLGEREDAFTHYAKKIEEIDGLANEEYARIVETRLRWHNASVLELGTGEGGDAQDTTPQTAQDLYSLFVPSKIRRMLGSEAGFFHGTGVVVFKSIAAKQSAVQCNLSGQPYWMITSDAPDPRDLFWSNIGIDRNTLENRKILVQVILLGGILGWGTIVKEIQDFTRLSTSWIPNSGFFAGVIRGYLPALVVSLVLLWMPMIIFLLARHVIHFKSHTEADEFVLVWNTGYRIANVFFTLFGISLIEAFQCFREYPDAFLQTLSVLIIKQSTFLMNLIILAAGQETMLQLLQWRSLLKQAVLRPLINVNARSRRYLDWLNEAPEFEESFIFGFFAPVLSYGLMIAMIYSFMAPIMLGVCMIFFWTATKVHTHNALYVYCQRCEGGGKLFYYWNRIVFITLYTSIIIFSAMIALKKHENTAFIFVVLMTVITYSIDRAVNNKFVVNSLHLPLTIAQIHDKEEGELLASAKMKPDGGENFMYRHPILNQNNWDAKPTWK